MNRRKRQLVSLIAVFATGFGIARADFIPGRLYISARSSEFCDVPGEPNERIYEFDPKTGNYRVFATIPDEHCTGLTGLTFTPDGSGLRASAWISSSILEYDGDAKLSVPLDASDGIGGPMGSNNIAYDSDENFYVVNAFPNIMRFPSDGGAGEIYANRSDGIVGVGPIALSPKGDLYYAGSARFEVLRFAGPHEGIVFDTLPSRVWSLATDPRANLYVVTLDGVYRYVNGDPSTRELLAPISPGIGGPLSSITFSPANNVLYLVDAGSVWVIDPEDGDATNLGFIPGPFGVNPGSGIAVYVPEPNTILGDLNCDGAFDGADIDVFFLALVDADAYEAQYPNCDRMLGDMNRDGFLDGADINLFFTCLVTGGCP